MVNVPITALKIKAVMMIIKKLIFDSDNFIVIYLYIGFFLDDNIIKNYNQILYIKQVD